MQCPYSFCSGGKETHELLAAYHKEFEHPSPREQPQRISHTCARADDGVVIAMCGTQEKTFRR